MWITLCSQALHLMEQSVICSRARWVRERCLAWWKECCAEVAMGCLQAVVVPFLLLCQSCGRLEPRGLGKWTSGLTCLSSLALRLQWELLSVPEGPPLPFQLSRSDSVSFELLGHLNFYDIQTTHGLPCEIISRHVTHTKAEKSTVVDCSKHRPANSSVHTADASGHCKEQLVPPLWLSVRAQSYKGTWIQWGFCTRHVLAGEGIALFSCFCLSSNGKGAVHPAALRCHAKSFPIKCIQTAEQHFSLQRLCFILITGTVRTMRNQPVV